MAAITYYFPTAAITFAVKSKLDSLLNKGKTESQPAIKLARNVMVGGAAGGITLGIVYSIVFCRTRLANDVLNSKHNRERQFSGIVDVIRKTLQSDGIAGLYRGFVVSCIGLVVYRGCYFGFYDTVKPVMLFGSYWSQAKTTRHHDS